jgi:hypothetical protein
VRDTAGLYGGDIVLSESDFGGLRAVLILPAAEKSEGKESAEGFGEEEPTA